MVFITDLQENSVKNNHRVVYAMHAKTPVVIKVGWVERSETQHRPECWVSRCSTQPTSTTRRLRQETR
ncbi:hypothetical protein H6H01_34925 [Nostoc calcicola FACHB-3891]|nr:hypothetical protein [Nostoc calcicola FACHB-3891]